MLKILLYAPQVLLTVFFVWPFRPTRIDPGQAFQASTGDDMLDIYNRGCDGINLRLSNSTFTRNTAKVTAAALWRTDINKPRSTLAFSGHGSSIRETMPKILLYAPQVLLTIFFVWPFRPTRIDPGQAFQASTGDDVLDIYNCGCDGINLRLSNSTFTRNTAK
ncbi:hypothetical protein MRX96_051510, partial [Rhipicephalus microplus]